jgi:transcriptional regulator with XRE-family HTH domain
MAITGSQLHAARALAGWSRRDLAAHAKLNRETIAVWERSSDATVRTMSACLDRAVAALAGAGVTFTDDGVRLHRPAQVSTTIPSEGVAA